MATGQSTGKPVEYDISSRPVLAEGTTQARTLRDRFDDVLNVRDFGAVGDGTTNDATAIQAAINALSGARGLVFFPAGIYVWSSASRLDAKRAILRGVGVPGNSGGGGTVIAFSGTAGVYSSVEDNYGFAVENLELKGSNGGTPSATGQVLLDFTGQNYPRVFQAKVSQGDVGVKLKKGTVVESHYGTFHRLDVSQCYVGVSMTSTGGGSDAGSHGFFGGRIWNTTTGILIGAGINQVTITGMQFECGPGNVAVDSAGAGVTFVGNRFETAGTNIRIRSGAGFHYSLGDFWSSGFDVVDDNLPSVMYGLGATFGSLPAAWYGGNLATNGSFEHFTGTGLDNVTPTTDVGDGWTWTFSSKGTSTAAAEAVEVREGAKAQKIVTGTGNNVRLGQFVPTVSGRWYTARALYRLSTGTGQLRVGTTLGGSEVSATGLTADDAWHEVSIPFQATAASTAISFYFSGTTDRTFYVDGVTVTAGRSGWQAQQPKALSEDGGSVYGTPTFRAGLNVKTASVSSGTGSPEGVVAAPVGSLYLRSDGGAATTLYVKETGTGNTGWAAK